jgi:hypothetical protein
MRKNETLFLLGKAQAREERAAWETSSGRELLSTFRTVLRRERKDHTQREDLSWYNAAEILLKVSNGEP